MADDGLDPYPYAEESGKKMKANAEKSQKFELEQASGSESQVLLDLMKLSSDETTQKSTMEFNFFKSGTVSGSSSRANNDEATDESTREDKTLEPKTYGCNFCDREFSSSQALGGHQNAHKQERDMMKKLTGKDVVLRHPHSPCYPICGPYNRVLGVRMDSMIQKPHSYGWIPPRYGHGGGWPQRQAVMNPSLTLDHGPTTESFQAYTGGGFGGVLRSSENPRVENSTIPFIHLSDSSNLYVAESSATALKEPTLTRRGGHHVKLVEESVKLDGDQEHPGLDLTLKL